MHRPELSLTRRQPRQRPRAPHALIAELQAAQRRIRRQAQLSRIQQSGALRAITLMLNFGAGTILGLLV